MDVVMMLSVVVGREEKVEQPRLARIADEFSQGCRVLVVGGGHLSPPTAGLGTDSTGIVLLDDEPLSVIPLEPSDVHGQAGWVSLAGFGLSGAIRSVCSDVPDFDDVMFS